ncbi:MAG: iron ABC transporter permease [Eubacteriaceae bacterium]|nr:iron ABC transporter permease [Eubacteriaceae bacterium]MBR5995655.1 iron ABC transporter permease [Eubacteriaceae bacterium]
MKKKTESFRLTDYVIFISVMLAAMVLCICLGSVNVPLKDIYYAISDTFNGTELCNTSHRAIIMSVRLPRVCCAALTGAALSICGAAMQGLLQNPLADGSTLGVTSGAALGAILSIAFGMNLPMLANLGQMGMAMLFGFMSLVLILTLAYRLDKSLSTQTIILIGVIFSMFVSAIINLVVTFAGERVKNITFWSMGSLSGSSFENAGILLIAVTVFGSIILKCARELNAFAIGEDNARNIGVDVKKFKLIILITVSALIGVTVSIAGTIGFVGLVIPHMTRLIVGPNHRRLLPASFFGGSTFLLLADLVARTMLRPLVLPIGVVTSFIGSIVFIYIFYSSRRKSHA